MPDMIPEQEVGPKTETTELHEINFDKLGEYLPGWESRPLLHPRVKDVEIGRTFSYNGAELTINQATDRVSLLQPDGTLIKVERSLSVVRFDPRDKSVTFLDSGMTDRLRILASTDGNLTFIAKGALVEGPLPSVPTAQS